MPFLILKILSSVGLGIVLKDTDARGLPRLPVIRMNYAAAALLAFAAAYGTGHSYVAQRTSLLAVITGVLFVAGILVWTATIRAAGLALSVVAMRTAIVIPVLASTLIWHERPAPRQLAGAAAALLALGLVLSEVARPRAGDRRARSAPLWLAGLFLIDGAVMVPAQVFSRHVTPDQNLPFQTIIFLTGFIITTIIYFVRRERTTSALMARGALLGTCNLGNYLFLVLALGMLPGVVVYPVIAAGEVGLLALSGTVIWKERVGPRAWAGIVLAAAALILVQFGRN